MATNKTFLLDDFYVQFRDNGQIMDVTLTQISTGNKFRGARSSVNLDVASVEAYNSSVLPHTPDVQYTFRSRAGDVDCRQTNPAVATLDERLEILSWKAEHVARSSVPSGTIQAFAGAVAPNGWLICDGKTIGNWDSQADFADNSTYSLFLLLHRSFTDAKMPIYHRDGTRSQRGSTSAEDHYNHKMRIQLPDLRGKTIIGCGHGASLTLRTLGDTGGKETVQLTESELPAHTHKFGEQNFGVRSTGKGVDKGNFGSILTATSFLNSAQQARIQSSGGDQPHENMPPFVVLNYIIKV